MARFEADILASDHKRADWADLPGQWAEAMYDAQQPKWITLGMDSSVSPARGEQEGTVWSGHFGCECYHPLFVLNRCSDGAVILSVAPCVRAMSTALMTGRRFFSGHSPLQRT